MLSVLIRNGDSNEYTQYNDKNNFPKISLNTGVLEISEKKLLRTQKRVGFRVSINEHSTFESLKFSLPCFLLCCLFFVGLCGWSLLVYVYILSCLMSSCVFDCSCLAL